MAASVPFLLICHRESSLSKFCSESKTHWSLRIGADHGKEASRFFVVCLLLSHTNTAAHSCFNVRRHYQNANMSNCWQQARLLQRLAYQNVKANFNKLQSSKYPFTCCHRCKQGWPYYVCSSQTTLATNLGDSSLQDWHADLQVTWLALAFLSKCSTKGLHASPSPPFC